MSFLRWSLTKRCFSLIEIQGINQRKYITQCRVRYLKHPSIHKHFVWSVSLQLIFGNHIPQHWSRPILNKLIADTPDQIITERLNTTQFDPEKKTQLFLCTCSICKFIIYIQRPVIVTSCVTMWTQFLLTVGMVHYLEGGRDESKTRCPSYNMDVKIDTEKPSSTIASILANLKLDCEKGCGYYIYILRNCHMDLSAQATAKTLHYQIYFALMKKAIFLRILKMLLYMLFDKS